MSLARSSRPTAFLSPNLRAWAPSRLGVASRLLLAFLGISGLGVVGATVAIFSFRDIGQVLDRITVRRVPAALASVEVSRQVERIVSAAPALLSAAAPADHTSSQDRRRDAELAALLGLEHAAPTAMPSAQCDRPPVVSGLILNRWTSWSRIAWS